MRLERANTEPEAEQIKIFHGLILPTWNYDRQYYLASKVTRNLPDGQATILDPVHLRHMFFVRLCFPHQYPGDPLGFMRFKRLYA